MCGGWLIGSSVTRAQGWGGGLSLYFVRAAELACFSQFLQAPFDKSSQISLGLSPEWHSAMQA